MLALVFSALLLATAVAAFWDARPGADATAGSTPGYSLRTERESQGRISVAFLGDSYTQGAGTNNLAKAYANYSAQMLNWDNIGQFAVGGTGYVTGGENRFYSRTDELISAKPSVAIVVGSRNDVGLTYAQINPAAVEVFAKIRKELPQTVLIVVGPIWNSSEIPEAVRVDDAAVRDASASTGAIYIDAISNPWIPNSKYLSSDSVHPNEMGHRLLAVELVASIEKLCLDGTLSEGVCRQTSLGRADTSIDGEN